MRVRFLFDPRDCWVGIYFKKPWSDAGQVWYEVYVCILPFFPIKFSWEITKSKYAQK
jgi:hypothetical protein